MIIFSSRLIKLASNKQDDYIILSIRSSSLNSRILDLIELGKNTPLDLTLSGAKTSDFIAICKGDESINFGKNCYLGRMEIVDDTTFRWYPLNGIWNILSLSIANQGIDFLVKSYLKNTIVELF